MLNDLVHKYIRSDQGQWFPNMAPMPQTKDEKLKFAMGMMPIAGVKEILPFQVAQPAARIGQAMDLTGNISLDETHQVLKLARQYLKLPTMTLTRMPLNQIIAELRGMFRPDQAMILGR